MRDVPPFGLTNSDTSIIKQCSGHLSKASLTRGQGVTEERMSNFEELRKINVNGKTEKKNGLTYLSWAWAWDEFCKVYPDASYKVYKNEQGLPYVYDVNTGYMCYVEVTAGGKTHEMWLPVMDSANNAMKSEAYKKKTKYKEVTVEAATMFDINKTIMRCLVKCLAMFGLGLYIYAGEDLPEDETPREPEPMTREEMMNKIEALMDITGVPIEQVLEIGNVSHLAELEDARLAKLITWLEAQK